MKRKEKLCFLLENVCQDIRGKLYLHTVVFLILVIGVSVPLWVGQMLYDLRQNALLSRYEEPECLIVAEYKDMIEEAEAGAMEKRLAVSAGAALECVGAGALFSSTVSWEGQPFFTRLQGCTEHFWELNGYEVVEGDGPETEWDGGGLPCWIKEGSRLHEMGLRAGDRLEAEGIVIAVAGIIRAPKLYGAVAVSYEMAASCWNREQAQFQTLFLFEEQADMSAVRMALADRNIVNIISILPGTQQEQIYVDSVYAVAQERLLTGAMMLAFAALSLSAVISGMIALEKKCMAVRMAIGAARCALFREHLLRMELLFALACATDALLYPVLFGTLHGMSRRLKPSVCIAVWILLAVLLLLQSALLWHRRFRSTGLISMLKEEA